MRLPAKVSLLCAALLLAAGCAHGATAVGMTLTQQDLAGPPSPAVAGLVAVGNVTGGEETNPATTPKIADGPFREALQASLRLAGLLSDQPNPPLVVSATLVKLDQPMFALDMTVTSVVRYTVREARTGAVVIDEEITAAHTATVGQAFAGTTRLQLANEGSARKNIALLVKRLNTIRKNAPAAAPSS
ncbi:MAG TPA: hypothetical protein VIW03_05755 [Anaeromyxobacter sp.]